MDPKRLAAQTALELVENGMTLGLGSGRTALAFVELLGERLAQGRLGGLRGVPTSAATAALARRLHIPLTSLEDLQRQQGGPPRLDLAVDGADEVDARLDLIKGLGRALLREKIIELHAARLVIIVDESKLTARLGALGPLPVEVLPFEAEVTLGWLAGLGCRAAFALEPDGSRVRTDNGNYLAHCRFDLTTPPGIPDAPALAQQLAQRPGVVEHGLFLGMAALVICAGPAGVRCLERPA